MPCFYIRDIPQPREKSGGPFDIRANRYHKQYFTCISIPPVTPITQEVFGFYNV